MRTAAALQSCVSSQILSKNFRIADGCIVGRFGRPVSACLLVNTGTSGCSASSLLCGVPLNIGAVIVRSFADTIYEEAERKYQEANKKSANNLFQLGVSFEMIHRAMPDISEGKLHEMESRIKREKNPS